MAFELVQKHTKPKLVVKNVNGKQYLQLITVNGDLIHIGSTEKLENWGAGIQALEHAYSGLAIREALELDYEKAAKALNTFTGRKECYKKQWDKYCEKWVQVQINAAYIASLFSGKSEEETFRELVQIRTNLETSVKAANAVNVSLDYYQVIITEVVKREEAAQ